MKEVMRYYARCNREINANMAKIIGEKIESPMSLALKGYFFPTLGKLLEHIYIADMVWIKAFGSVDDCGLDFEKELGPTPDYKDVLFTDFDSYRERREAFDEFIERYAEKVGEGFFSKKVVRVNRRGERTEKDVWKAVLHCFNHQTHHRGQVSCILDELGIENDYSNMIRIE